MSPANWVSNIIAFLALGVAGLALYLQRKDRNPDLSISATDKMVAQMVDNGMGGAMDGPLEPAQVFELRNVGLRDVTIDSVQARWLVGPPVRVLQGWHGLPVLHPDRRHEHPVFTSKIISETPSFIRRILPFYRVDFLDAVGRRWTAGYRRVRL
jgi:hypothetical protein